MGWDQVSFIRTIEVDAFTAAGLTLTVYSDLPGDAIALRETKTLPPRVGPRSVWKFHFAGTTKGRLFKFALTSTGVVRLFGVRVYARTVGGDWRWIALQVEETADAWQEHPLPIPATADEWAEAKLAIDPTPEEWAEVKLAIDPTPEEWSGHPVPIPATSDDWAEAKLAIDPTPEEWSGHPVPIPATADEWRDFEVPLPKTPDIYEWLNVAVTP